MKKKRKLLVSSMIMILFCCLLFAGTTFAWFSDRVTSSNNIITAGNLDVELEYSYDGANWDKVDKETYVFNQKALWEPGYTEYVFLRVSNLGSLSLKYTLSINATEKTGTNVYGDEYKLSDHLTVSAVVSDELSGGKLDREDALAILDDEGNEIGFGVISQSSALLKNEADYIQLVIAMPTSVGNEANPLKGKEASVSFSLNLIATQLNNESDSFGPDYDVNAPWVGGVNTDWYFENTTATTFELNSAEDLAGLAAIVNGTAEAKTRSDVKDNFKDKTIVLNRDLDLSNLPWTPIGSNENPFLGNFDGAGHTVYNLNVKNEGWAGLFGHVGKGVGTTIKNLNIINAEISSSRMAGAIVGQIYGDVINCHVENANILVTPNLVGSSYDNGDKVGGIVGWLGDNGDNRALSDCSATNVYISGYRDLGGIVGYVASSTTVANNKVNGLVIKGDQVTYHYGNKDFNLRAICGRVNGTITETENVYDNVDISGYYLKDGVEYFTNLTNPEKPLVLLYDVTDDFVGSKLIVPEGVTALRNKNLNGDTRIKEVILPLSVTDFGGTPNKEGTGASGSFFYNSAVEKVALPEGLKEIPVAAFNQAYNLKEVNIPSTVTTLGINAFGGCGLESLTIPATITSIGYGAFRDMASLETIVFEGDVVLPGYALRACTNLKTVVFNGTVSFADSTARGMVITNKTNGDGSAITVFVSNEESKEALLAKDTASKDYGGYEIVIGGYAVPGTTEELYDAINNKSELIILSQNVTVNSQDSANPSQSRYGEVGVQVQEGGLLDGNGNTLTVTGANGTYDCGIYASSGTIQNITVNGSFRGIFNGGLTGDLTLNNVVIDKVCYTFHIDGTYADKHTVTFNNCTLNGWTSYSNVAKVFNFNNCNFGQGTGGYNYAFCRPYNDSVFTGCVFSVGYEFDASDTGEVTFVNCYVGNTLITQENVAELLGSSASSIIVSNK